MVYFRELPLPLNKIDNDFMELFYRFANTFTEESVLHGYLKEEAKAQEELKDNDLRELGYTDEDILNM